MTNKKEETKKIKRLPSGGDGVPDGTAVSDDFSPAVLKKSQQKIVLTEKGRKRSLPLRSFILQRFTLFLPLLVVTLLAGFKMRDLANRFQNKNASLFILKERKQRFEELKSQFYERKEDFSKIEKFLPKEKEIVNFVSFLDDLSSPEVSVSAFHFETEEPLPSDKGHSFLSFTLVLSGKFEDLKNFLVRLLSGPYLIKPYFGEIKSSDNIFESASLIIRSRLFVDQNFH